MLLWMDFSSFSNLGKKVWKVFFQIFTKVVRPNCSQFTKKFKFWDFWSLFDFIFCQIERMVFQAWYICMVNRGGPNLRCNHQLSRKWYVQIYIYFVSVSVKSYQLNFAGVTPNPRSRTKYLEQITFICVHLVLLGLFPIGNNIFINFHQCRFFFTSGIGLILWCAQRLHYIPYLGSLGFF